MSLSKASIYTITYQELHDLMTSWHEKQYRAEQVWRGVYQHFYSSFDDFSNIPVRTRERLSSNFSFFTMKPIDIRYSKDRQTQKQVFKLLDGNLIETVLMTYDKRMSLCISSQSGCGMGCIFCATGEIGLNRNLNCGEIIEQVLFFYKLVRDVGKKINNIVIMGMGEPFQNYTATIHAINTLNHKQGLNIGDRRFTISTAGLVPGIIKLSEEQRQINLAISLHAAENDLRSKLMPINGKYPINQVIEACRYYIKKTNRRVSFEWAMIRNVNDTPDQAHLLANLLKGLLCHVNLIPLNRNSFNKLYPSTENTIKNFKSILTNSGISCSIRVKRGVDIAAGCGQLAYKNILLSDK